MQEEVGLSRESISLKFILLLVFFFFLKGANFNMLIADRRKPAGREISKIQGISGELGGGAGGGIQGCR